MKITEFEASRAAEAHPEPGREIVLRLRFVSHEPTGTRKTLAFRCGERDARLLAAELLKAARRSAGRDTLGV